MKYKKGSMGFSKRICTCILLIAQWLFVINSLEGNNTYNSTSMNDDLLPSSLTIETTMEITEGHNEIEVMDKGFAECGAFTLEPGEYILLPNGSAFVEVYNKTYDPSAYSLKDGFLLVCPPVHEDDDENEDEDSDWKFDISLTYITRIGLSISIICLTLHLIAFSMIPDMRNLPGYNMASLCISLLFGYVSFMVAHAETVQDTRILCICAAAAFQFFMLSSFFWMSTLALIIFRSLLKATGKLRLASSMFSCKKYCINCLYSWGAPLLFVIATLVLDYAEGVHDNFRPKFGTTNICWFRQRIPLLLFFALPVMIIVISNIIFFGSSAYIIYSNRMKVDGDEAYKNMLKRNFLMHSRLATIMGIAWFVGVLAGLVNTPWLWYIDTLFNTLQGLFIFLAFTCTQKVKKCVTTLWSSNKRKAPSATSPSVLFQSHWNSGLSLDDDIDMSSVCNIVKREQV